MSKLVTYEQAKELKHIQYYPIGGENAIKIVDNFGNIFKVQGIEYDNSDIKIYAEYSFFIYDSNIMKLLLHPMSDLYKPLEDGSIPIVELAKLATESYGVFDYNLITRNNVQEVEDIEVICKHKDSGAKLIFKYSDFILGFALLSKEDGEAATVFNQLKLFEYLFKHHFDVYGLIKKRLAIDIKTIQD